MHLTTLQIRSVWLFMGSSLTVLNKGIYYYQSCTHDIRSVLWWEPVCRPGSGLERWRCSAGRRSEPLRCAPDEGNPPETTGTPWLRWVWVSSGSGRTRCLNYWRSFYYLAPAQTLWRERNQNLSLPSYTNVVFCDQSTTQCSIILIFIFMQLKKATWNFKRYIYIWKS